jgi:hypothetical protein
MGAFPAVHFRRSERKPVALAVRYGRPDPGAVLRHRGRTADVSMDGIFVECDRLPEVGSAVRIELAAPTAWQVLALDAVVRWVSPGPTESEARRGRGGGVPGGDAVRGFGARFVSLDAHAAAALHALLRAADYLGEEEP